MTRDAEYPTPIQFITFVVLAMLIAVFAFWGFVAALALPGVLAEPEVGTTQLFSLAFGMYVFTLAVGWPIWGPILLCALFPGCVVFVIVRRLFASLPIGNHGPVLFAAAAVAVFSWGATSALFWVFDLSSQPFQNAFLLLPGVPAAMIAALIVLPKPE